MTRPAALPRVLGPDLLERLQISRSRRRTELRRGTWQGLAAGIVLTRPDEPTREDWADVGLILAGPGSALTGWDAVRARGIGDRRPMSDLVVVLSVAGMNRVVGGVRIRRTQRRFTRHVQPLGAAYELTPLASTARAVADTALDCRDLGTVRALLGAALLRRLCTVEELLAEYGDSPRNRTAFFRAALEDVQDGARSAAEAAAARRLDHRTIPPFELNVPVHDQHGILLFVLDVLWRELRAGVEIDSRRHHSGVLQWDSTFDRHNDLTRWKLALMHYSPRRITASASTFVPEVAEWLAGRGQELGVARPPGRGPRRPPLGADPPPFVVQRSILRPSRSIRSRSR